MFTVEHTKYLDARLAETEAVTRGWQELLDHAVPRLPEVIVTTLREQHAAAEEISEGWRSLKGYAEAGRTRQVDAESWPTDRPAPYGEYTTGGRLPPPPPPAPPSHGDTLVAPAVPQGEPWRDSWFRQPPGTDPAPTAVMPEVGPGQDPAEIVDRIAEESRRASAMQRLSAAEDAPDGPQHRAPRPGRDPYAQQDGGQA